MDHQPTVFLVDDTPEIRDILRRLLETVGLNVKSFASANEFLDQYDPEAVGCLVLDVRLPGMSGLELQQRLKEMNSDLPIILISGHADVPMAVRGIKAGALDFFEKPFNHQVLLDRIQQGIADHLALRQRKQQQRQVESRIQTLTRREREVMELLVSGMTNKQIAEKLEISRKTLDIHRSKVLQKMQTETVADLVRQVLSARQTDGAA